MKLVQVSKKISITSIRFSVVRKVLYTFIYHKKIIFNLIAALFLLWSLLFAEETKIDPALSIMMMEGKSELKTVKYKSIFSINNEVPEPEVDVIVKTNNSFKDLEKVQGLKIHSKIKEYFTATIPLNQVGKLASLPNVVFIESSVKCKQLLDVSVPATKANEVRDSLSYRGKNVIVGIVDSGIDFKHYDFRNVDGTSRIKYIWDQTLTLVTGESNPAGYGYGVEYNQNQINGSLTSTSVRQQDSSGHGTHVAGIATGNGLGTGGSIQAGTYAGVATEADIIAVNSTMLTGAVIDAVNYIFAKAASFNQPAVINLSLGTHLGSHDGKSSFESSLDSSTGAGKIIVAAAGNEGNSAIHASGTAPATVFFNAVSSSLSYITIWYKGADSMDVIVTSPPNVTGPISPGNSVIADTPDGRVIISSSINTSYNSDKNIIIQIDNGAGKDVKKGVWSFTLSAGTITNGKFDAWCYDAAYTTFVSPDYDYTVGMPATANKVIAVASYNTKKTWKDINNKTQTTLEILSGISSFSSRGPTRDGRQKPDLTAPGSRIASTMSSSVAFSNSLVMPDGKHVVMEGTSMASPHVAGTVALMLQKNRNLTPELVITTLTGKATQDANTGSVWNKYWGYGKMNALAAVSSITTYQVVTPEISEHYCYPNPVRGNKATFKVSTNVNAEATIKIYNIAGELVAKITGDAAIGDNRFEWDVSSVAPGIYFYILYLKARDTDIEMKSLPGKIAIIK